MSNFTNKNVTIIGAARSGLASAEALKNLGANVFLSEFKKAEFCGDTEKTLRSLKIDYEFGGHSERIYKGDLIVTSPGVPADSSVLVKAREKDIKIISELELGFLLCAGNVLAITGSNGKTTTTSLVGEIFKQAGIEHVVAGNIGTPFVSVAQKLSDDGWAIVEVSTFQLEWTDKFKPKVAAVLNITPDHLDRHKTMANYIGLKLKIFANQNGIDKAVVNFDDDKLKNYKSQSAICAFSTNRKLDSGCYIENESMYFADSAGTEKIIETNEISIKGPHNMANACAAAACCKSAGIANEAIAAGLRNFKGVEHRLEMTGLIGGVSYVNDSKATNVDAVYWALQSVPTPIILIAGGRDKAGDFSALNELVATNVRYIIAIGEAADKIESSFKDATEIVRAASLDAAVKLAHDDSRDAKTVLLSPGCASFDMFDNFEHRGKMFKKAVDALAKEVRR